MYKVNEAAIIHRYQELIDIQIETTAKAHQDAQDIGLMKDYSADKIERLANFFIEDDECNAKILQEFNCIDKYIIETAERLIKVENGETED